MQNVAKITLVGANQGWVTSDIKATIITAHSLEIFFFFTAYTIMRNDSPSIAQVVAKRRRLTNEEAERVIQTFTF